MNTNAFVIINCKCLNMYYMYSILNIKSFPYPVRSLISFSVASRGITVFFYFEVLSKLFLINFLHRLRWHFCGERTHFIISIYFRHFFKLFLSNLVPVFLLSQSLYFYINIIVKHKISDKSV